MLNKTVAVGVSVLVAACAAPPNTHSTQPPPGGETFLGVIAMPFVVAFKIPLCVASAAVAAPIVGVSMIAGGGEGERELRRALGEGLEQNCGPPWGVSP